MLLTLNEISIQLIPPHSKTNVEIIPPMQLLSRLLDLCKIFVKEGTSDIGFLDFLIEYYNKKHPTCYERSLGSLVASILKHGEHGTDVHLFGKIIDTNAHYNEVKFISRGVEQLEKKRIKINRNETSYRNIKLNLPEILKTLNKIFGKRVENKFDNKNLQARIREYFSKFHTGAIIETDGLSFLHVVRKEAKHHINNYGTMDSESYCSSSQIKKFDLTNHQESNEDNIYNIECEDTGAFETINEEIHPQERARNFYNINKIFKQDGINPLPKDFINTVKNYHTVKSQYLPEMFQDHVDGSNRPLN